MNTQDRVRSRGLVNPSAAALERGPAPVPRAPDHAKKAAPK